MPPQLVELRYASFEDAQRALTFSIRPMRGIPPSMRLTALQSFQLTGDGVSDGESKPNALSATFTGPGSILSVDQFEVDRDEPFDVRGTLPHDPPSDIARGSLQVGDTTAFWMAGAMIASGAAESWDLSVLVLTWLRNGVGYRIQARGLTLADLVAVAASLT